MRIGLGLSIPAVAARGSGGRMRSETIALLGRMTPQPSADRAMLYDRLIGRLIDGGIWPKLDAIHLFAAHSTQAALLNLKGTSHGATAVNSPAFTADRGYAGNGTTSYVGSGFNPATASGTQFAQNGALFGIWNNSDGQADSSSAGFVSGSAGISIAPRNSYNQSSGRINHIVSTASANGSTMDARGLFLIVRSGAAATQLYRNGTLLASGTEASITPVDGELRYGSISATGYSSRQISAGIIGGVLSGAEVVELWAATAQYLNAVGVS